MSLQVCATYHTPCCPLWVLVLPFVVSQALYWGSTCQNWRDFPACSKPFRVNFLENKPLNMVGTGPRWMFSQHCTVVLEVGFYGVFLGGGGSCAPFELFLDFSHLTPCIQCHWGRYHLHQLYWWRVSTLWTNRLFLAPLPFVWYVRTWQSFFPSGCWRENWSFTRKMGD